MALKSTLGKIASGLDGALDTGSYRTSEDQLEAQQSLTPVATGDLQGSERIEPAAGQGNGQYQVVAGDAIGKQRKRPIDYAGIIEADQPYAAPAARALDPALRPAEEMRKLVRRNKV